MKSEANVLDAKSVLGGDFDSSGNRAFGLVELASEYVSFSEKSTWELSRMVRVRLLKTL